MRNFAFDGMLIAAALGVGFCFGMSVYVLVAKGIFAPIAMALVMPRDLSPEPYMAAAKA